MRPLFVILHVLQTGCLAVRAQTGPHLFSTNGLQTEHIDAIKVAESSFLSKISNIKTHAWMVIIYQGLKFIYIEILVM